MLITTSDLIPGKNIKSVQGLVRGSSARTRNVGRDILAFAKNIVGGEVHEYTKLIGESREQALDRMIDEAKRLGSNAIVALRFSSTSISQGISEVVAYGTAVTID